MFSEISTVAVAAHPFGVGDGDGVGSRSELGCLRGGFAVVPAEGEIRVSAGGAGSCLPVGISVLAGAVVVAEALRASG